MVDLERLRENLKYIRRGRGLTFAKLAECQYVMEALGDVPLRVAYERLSGMVRMLGEDVQAVTWWPRATSCGTSRLPTTPVPPATNTRMIIHLPDSDSVL